MQLLRDVLVRLVLYICGASCVVYSNFAAASAAASSSSFRALDCSSIYS